MVIAMKGHIQHSWFFFKSMLDAIAMVHIPVNYQYPQPMLDSKTRQFYVDHLPLASQVVNGMPGSYCYIVIEAKAMWLVWLGMVAGWSY
ncbi:hypothetical protein E2C01_064952 [Portunus trituberculatus]|uniref:Uncharacterized protein n=1 Tax=Portunus trituberculatus TaxID=210409 RepID=A0A5B7HPT5_PORTR|nr:hypothetical protein [Portunus trituberculatus]